ncbi:hypothetical protein ENBRE01_2540, partial [Enteropsectra breve]
GIDVTTNDIFLKMVPNRRKITLGPLIEKHIAHGSDVHSDKHKTYLSIFKNNPNYNHSYLNHMLHFVDSVTGCIPRTLKICGVSLSDGKTLRAT